MSLGPFKVLALTAGGNNCCDNVLGHSCEMQIDCNFSKAAVIAFIGLGKIGFQFAVWMGVEVRLSMYTDRSMPKVLEGCQFVCVSCPAHLVREDCELTISSFRNLILYLLLCC